jgi:Type VI secretion system/phage-baseplate injector OB domain
MPEPDHSTRTLGERGYQESLLPFGEPDARDPDPEVRKRFFGKYRGTVVDNEDPLQQGRLIVLVPDVLGFLPSTWATPCLPFAGPLMGQYVRPAIGAGVWVEFEQGDPQTPIWTGCFWGDPPQLPPSVAEESFLEPGVPVVTIETTTGGLSICDVPLGPFGSVCLRSGASMIIMTQEEITITSPAINVVAEGVVSILGDTVEIGAATAVSVTAPAIELAGDVNVTGAMNVEGAVDIAGATNVAGAVDVGGEVSVAGATQLAGAVTVGGVMTVDGIIVP